MENRELEKTKQETASSEPERAPAVQADDAELDRELKRSKKSEYDKLRKIKRNFLKDNIARVALRLELDKGLASREPGMELLVPPIDTKTADEEEKRGRFFSSVEATKERDKMKRFWLKQAWDNFAQPILDYENLKKDAEKLPSNTKKKAALRALEEQRAAAEARLAELPDWNSGASDEEKIKYLRHLEKLL